MKILTRLHRPHQKRRHVAVVEAVAVGGVFDVALGVAVVAGFGFAGSALLPGR